MTKDEKRAILVDYCGNVIRSCGDCALAKGEWENTTEGVGCLDFDNSPESDFDKALELIGITVEDEPDPVNHPSHYADGKIEPIDFIEDKKLGFCLGNAVKYISRAGKKDPTKEIEDLKKAVFYLNYRIKQLEEARL